MLFAALLMFAAAAGVSAAPYVPDHYSHHHHPYYYPAPPLGNNYGLHSHPAFGREMFDARRFWMDLSREMMSIDQMIQDLHRRFPVTTSTSGYVDGTYKVTIPLEGFKDEEITVKAKNGLLMVQAIHKANMQTHDDVQKTYVDARNLPEDVDNEGNWTYDGKVLVIVFHIKTIKDEDNNSEQGSVTTETTINKSEETEAENDNKSREEIDTNQLEENMDADVGIKVTDDSSENQDIKTNFIPTPAPIHATTYAVDINDDVEFVPIKY